MSILTDYFKWDEAWENVKLGQSECLEDFEPKLTNITIELAKKFMKDQSYPMVESECYIENNIIVFNFGEEFPNYGETNVCEDYISVTFRVDAEDGIIQEINLDS